MSFSVVYAPVTVEVGQVFEVILANTLLDNATSMRMEVTCPAPRQETRWGEYNVDFTGQESMQGPIPAQARLAWPTLRFLEGTEHNTWTLMFEIYRDAPFGMAKAEARIQVLPYSGNDNQDVKPAGGVYRQIAPDGPVADDA